MESLVDKVIEELILKHTVDGVEWLAYKVGLVLFIFFKNFIFEQMLKIGFFKKLNFGTVVQVFKKLENVTFVTFLKKSEKFKCLNLSKKPEDFAVANFLKKSIDFTTVKFFKKYSHYTVVYLEKKAQSFTMCKALKKMTPLYNTVNFSKNLSLVSA